MITLRLRIPKELAAAGFVRFRSGDFEGRDSRGGLGLCSAYTCRNKPQFQLEIPTKRKYVGPTMKAFCEHHAYAYLQRKGIEE